MLPSPSESNFRSQWQQDRITNGLFFKGHPGGFYVDVGAHDGVEGSNSYFFEKELGWRGICIEANSVPFEKLKNNRDSSLCHMLHCAAYDSNSTVKFLQCQDQAEMLSGVMEAYDQRHFERIQGEVGGDQSKTKIVEIPARTLDSILEEHGIVTVDLLSIDVEGSEPYVLGGIDLNKIKVNVIVIEDNYPELGYGAHLHLENSGFNFRGRLGGDMIYENKELKFSWEKNK